MSNGQIYLVGVIGKQILPCRMDGGVSRNSLGKKVLQFFAADYTDCTQPCVAWKQSAFSRLAILQSIHYTYITGDDVKKKAKEIRKFLIN